MQMLARSSFEQMTLSRVIAGGSIFESHCPSVQVMDYIRYKNHSGHAAMGVETFRRKQYTDRSLADKKSAAIHLDAPKLYGRLTGLQVWIYANAQVVARPNSHTQRDKQRRSQN